MDGKFGVGLFTFESWNSCVYPIEDIVLYPMDNIEWHIY